jgi:hypothetical protein
MLERIYHYSGALNSWSWSKLYKNRKEGYGYEEEIINLDTQKPNVR